ncbi:YcaO-like family protein [Facilibium subflavum]|uniref:YcaO-like family protein n=1 Tax=Facilibium subflavum TaxID=2219058 RepID=UPI000E65849A|nr:YcaO-like family protein [Facilibium subflavum]
MLLNSLRICDPVQTLENIKPYLAQAEITRLANLTHLDATGIPIYTAIRPMAKSLSTSQGKAMTAIEAQIGAYMESLEVYFAENAQADILRQKLADNILFIDPNRLSSGVAYDSDYIHDWVRVHAWINDKPYYIPLSFVCMDTTNRAVLIEAIDTTGIASGNSFDEALLHSLLECIERQAIGLPAKMVKLDEEHTLYKKLAMHHYVKISYFPNQFNLPVFACYIQSKYADENQMIFSGYGAHLDKEIALNRALTEAIQSKVTTIAGSRDDIHKYAYIRQLKKMEIPAHDIVLSDINDKKAHMVGEGVQMLRGILSKLGLDALVYTYHQESLVFLKSIIVDSNQLFTRSQSDKAK